MTTMIAATARMDAVVIANFNALPRESLTFRPHFVQKLASASNSSPHPTHFAAGALLRGWPHSGQNFPAASVPQLEHFTGKT
jgi:hypothetical protein